MRGVVLTGFGDVDRLELCDVAEPVAGAGQIKVRLAATSVNPIDWKLRSGTYRDRYPGFRPPAILGRDAAGEVVGLGEGVSVFPLGAKVLGLVKHAYAEYVVDLEFAWAEVPPQMDLVDAAALPLVLLTGAQLIEEAVKPQPGNLVLITGALGSVGRAAVFAARALGAQVLLGVRRSQKEEAAKLELGGPVALDDDADIERLSPLDSIADTVGGDTLQKVLGKVRRGGTVGSVLGEPAGAAERGLTARAHQTHPDGKRLAELAAAVAAGKLVIPIAQRLPLEQVREAQTMAQRGAGGKIVLRIR